jgi:SAM-dependent methyltransferase/3-polyprenyl-4-hydroxybenzoate decarboxylase
MTDRLARARSVRAWDHGDATTVLAPDGTARRFTGDSAALARAVMEFYSRPRTRDELLRHLGDLTGAPVRDTTAVDQLVGVLRAVRALVPVNVTERASQPGTRARLLLGITGAVASANTPALILALQERGFEVRVMATRNAMRFVTLDAIEALTHTPVCDDLWKRRERMVAPHIQLAQWAEVVLVSPATATTIARIARGECSDVVSAVCIATRAPVVVAPSMNAAMYNAPAVQRNLDQLREDGVHLVHPAVGIEVADAPDAREPMLGPAPPADDLAAVVHAIVHAQRSSAPVLPASPEAWEALYATTAMEALPWTTDACDADIAAALAPLTDAPRRLLDLGAGAGTVALHAAKLGFAVVATDVSVTALAHGRRRSGSLAITWARDDILDTRVSGPFDVVVDRGCLHVLPRERHGEYVKTIERLLAPSGVLIVKVHDRAGSAQWGTHGYDEAGLRDLLGAAFSDVRVSASTLSGPKGIARAAWLALARRGS